MLYQGVSGEKMPINSHIMYKNNNTNALSNVINLENQKQMQNNIKGSLIGAGVSNVYGTNAVANNNAVNNQDSSMDTGGNGINDIKRVVKRKRNINPIPKINNNQ